MIVSAKCTITIVDLDPARCESFQEPPYPSLTTAQTMLLERFDIPYSVNKRQRWTIMSIGRKSISSLQVCFLLIALLSYSCWLLLHSKNA